MVKIPNIPVSFRKKIIDYQKKVGQKKFYKHLIKIDPKSKSKINSKDVQRSIRAFEVKKSLKFRYLTGLIKPKVVLKRSIPKNLFRFSKRYLIKTN